MRPAVATLGAPALTIAVAQPMIVAVLQLTWVPDHDRLLLQAPLLGALVNQAVVLKASIVVTSVVAQLLLAPKSMSAIATIEESVAASMME